MKATRLFTFCVFLFLLCLLVYPMAWGSSHAQSPNISDDIIEPNSSLTSRIIDVTKIDIFSR